MLACPLISINNAFAYSNPADHFLASKLFHQPRSCEMALHNAPSPEGSLRQTVAFKVILLGPSYKEGAIFAVVKST